MTDPRVLHRQVVRTVLTLCRLAERGTDERTREDITDACMSLLDAYLILQLQSSSAPVAPVTAPAKVAATPAVKRVASRATITRDLGNNSKKILQWLRDNPGTRTRDLITHFAGDLSDRTVMRSLKELAKAGLARRSQHEGAVVYEVEEEKQQNA